MALISCSVPIFLCVILVVLATQVPAQIKEYDISKYGAHADGKTDNSKVILNVWNIACQAKGRNLIYIPPGVFMTGALRLKGPCNGQMLFKIKGALRAPSDPQLGIDNWISFQWIDKLTVFGDGTFDGQGAYAWPYNNCKESPSCKLLPTTLRLDFVNNSRIHHVKFINSKNVHMSLLACHNVQIDHIRISAPGDSPNTDGIRIASSSGINIFASRIGTGDDCIAMLPGSRNVNITGVECGPGHGISVGSLGGTQDEEDVNGLLVQHCTFSGTLNGVRIKTKTSSYPGLASNITFQDLNMSTVYNPIIIDQQYCPFSSCAAGDSQVQISDAKFKNISGTSNSQLAINFLCSKSRPCERLELNNIDLDYHGRGGPVKARCINAKGISYGTQKPPSCF
ncbi:Glycoside hydrolase, family 28 [Dillenia turbinata]|uniref:Glycoside hydrolase, family 28 n=1 Tax=Dillenia turbinata TaxID=194707 RepID=A0AAN8VIZ6_9MAGN